VNRTLFRTRIKFCGLTRAGDVRLASELGVDAVGFVFAEGSPRRVHPSEARLMRIALEPMVDAIAVFRDNSAEQVRDAVRQVRPTVLQFHGDEDDAFCRGFGLPYVKAIAVNGAPVGDAFALQTRYPGASAFLFDAAVPGSGAAFDWSHLPTGLSKPFVLAGGLTPCNVFGAIQANQPWGVDVSTGIESAPGLKDGELMRQFVAEVRRADCVDLREGSDDIDACHACGR
jgi:phosphoribosylanthranilate isomerase